MGNGQGQIWWGWTAPGLVYGMLALWFGSRLVPLHWGGVDVKHRAVYHEANTPAVWGLSLAIVGMFTGAFLTATIPKWDMLWLSIGEHPWTTMPKLHVASYMNAGVLALGVLMVMRRLGARRLTVTPAEHATRSATTLCMLALTLLVNQVLMEAPVALATGTAIDGWVHSPVQDTTSVLFRLFVLPLVVVLLAEMFLVHPVLMFLRVGLLTGLSLYCHFLAYAFLEWCDHYDHFNAKACEPANVLDQMYSAFMAAGGIFVLGLMLAGVFFHGVLPRCVLDTVGKWGRRRVDAARTAQIMNPDDDGSADGVLGNLGAIDVNDIIGDSEGEDGDGYNNEDDGDEAIISVGNGGGDGGGDGVDGGGTAMRRLVDVPTSSDF